MKKILSIMLVAAFAMPIFAQEAQTPKAEKDYSEWLPQAGDWQIAFALDPFTKWIGNAFNGTNTTDLNDNTWTELFGKPIWRGTNVSIMGGYMLTDNLSLKANVSLGINLRTERQFIQDDAAVYLNPMSEDQVIDQKKTQNLAASFAVGVEYRVGKKRVQGVFGGGLCYGFDAINRIDYTYGNKITNGNQVPSSAYTAEAYMPAGPLAQARVLSRYADKGVHEVGAYGSVGVEWFVAPKIALGANVNVRLSYQFTPSFAAKLEGWNPTANELQDYTKLSGAIGGNAAAAPAQSEFNFNTENIGANLYVAFYF